MPAVSARDLSNNPQGFCCAECGKELALGEDYHEVPREGRPSDEVEAWCGACAIPIGEPS